MSENWINDGTYICEYCGLKFRVYAESEEPNVNFCPSCASSEIKWEESE